MQGPLVVDASYPITALSCLTPPGTLYAPEAAQSHTSWLHDEHPPNCNGLERLVVFITLWHACSLLHPDFFFGSAVQRVAGLWVPGFTTASVAPTSLERLAAAWLSPHSTHVPVLTSLGGDRLEVWLCDSVLLLSDAAQCLTSCVTVARSCQYVDYGLQNTGGDSEPGDSSVRISRQLLDTCYYELSDAGLPLAGERGCWRVGYEIDNGSTIVTVWMSPAEDCTPTTDPALFEGFWQGHCALSSGMASPDLNHPDSPSSSSEAQGQALAQDRFEVSHEARGVGLIIKALVQQNAGASLFLRTMAHIAALLCFAHAIFVLGERPSVFVGCRTS